MKPKTKAGESGGSEKVPESDPRSFYTPTRSVKVISTQNDPDISRSTMKKILITQKVCIRSKSVAYRKRRKCSGNVEPISWPTCFLE